MSKLIPLIKELISTPGVSGFETEIAQLIVSKIENYVDEVKVDRLGNVLAQVKGKGAARVLVDAHMDEVGLVVKAIDDKGFIRFEVLGGIDNRVLPAQRVIIHTRKGKIKGSIGIIPPHFTTGKERDKVIPAENLFIDIGASSREEAMEAGVRVVDPITLDRGLDELLGSRICGKAFDDRIGCLVAIESIKRLKDQKIAADLLYSFTVEEERGLRGATVSAYSLKPEIAFPVDTTGAADFPGVKPYTTTIELGKGPVIRAVDVRFVSDRQPREMLIETAEKMGIPYQLAVAMGSTDGAAVQLAREGVATCPLCVPLRYTHSPVEIVDLKDIENTIKLLTETLKSVT
ncbi:MAG: M42 family metallopeptidase [Candidatus Freyarchaeota archaeon]|nr:M42 family metallopeptidase [Candidatus Jordarchaeia archaeon]MBS7280309.1 M42 family metallopeptidase [Candidatus Jordarchaeia archaeon]